MGHFVDVVVEVVIDKHVVFVVIVFVTGTE